MGFGNYLSLAGRTPLLSAEQEAELTRAYCRRRDPALAQRLVLSNLRFVIKIAMEYGVSGARLLDLIQEGTLGLMMAVERFDPGRGVRLNTYAVWWIRAFIHRHLDRVAAVVAPPRRRPQPAGEAVDGAVLAGFHDHRPTPVAQVAEAEASQRDHAALADALGRLDPREQAILRWRYFSTERHTLRTMGESLGLSRERVRQIELQAKAKVRKRLAHLRAGIGPVPRRRQRH